MDQYNGHLIVLINTRTSDPGATGLLAYHDNGRKDDFDPKLTPHGHKFHHFFSICNAINFFKMLASEKNVNQWIKMDSNRVTQVIYKLVYFLFFKMIQLNDTVKWYSYHAWYGWTWCLVCIHFLQSYHCIV